MFPKSISKFLEYEKGIKSGQDKRVAKGTFFVISIFLI